LLEHGMLDAVVHRRDMKSYIARALDFMSGAVGPRLSAVS
jgi:acetyl-CoA carboxylase beta subunit